AARRDVVVQESDGQRRVVATLASTPQVPRWSPDGQWIAFIENSGPLWVVRPDGSGLRSISGYSLWPGVTWSPDATRIVGIGGPGTVVVDVASGYMKDLCWHPALGLPYSSEQKGLAWWRGTEAGGGGSGPGGL